MAETYIVGETKVRPGAYFNIQKTGNNAAASIISGVTAVIFKSDFGPLNQAVELNAEDGYADTFGTGGTTDAMQEAINGGAKTIIACRVGNGGTPATITLNDSEGEAAVTITALYPGKKAFTATIREKLSDSTLKECIIFSGTTEFEKVEFAAGDGEAAALVAALSTSKKFKAEIKVGKDTAKMLNVSQSLFTAGTDPAVKTEDYSNAFAEVEAFDFNTICVDTEETAVHILLHAGSHDHIHELQLRLLQPMSAGKLHRINEVLLISDHNDPSDYLRHIPLLHHKYLLCEEALLPLLFLSFPSDCARGNILKKSNSSLPKQEDK